MHVLLLIMQMSLYDKHKMLGMRSIPRLQSSSRPVKQCRASKATVAVTLAGIREKIGHEKGTCNLQRKAMADL